ncbi:histidine kinase [bacterium]|nr:histidine kinase [bacterium]
MSCGCGKTGGVMKSFFPAESDAGDLYIGSIAPSVPAGAAHFVARVAVYDSCAAAPRVEDVDGRSEGEFIERLSTHVYSAVHQAGGGAPYTVLREVVENLIHADFKEAVVSILDSGSLVRFSDQGPGIADKERALLPGFTTASSKAKRHIRGVGSGLPIVREFLAHSGGSLSIEDNLGTGTVVTLAMEQDLPDQGVPVVAGGVEAPRSSPPLPSLSLRQKKVLSLVLEFGEAGPTLVSKELAVGLSTAYRDLAFLEESGLIKADDSGKRVITDLGVTYLDTLFD